MRKTIFAVAALAVFAAAPAKAETNCLAKYLEFWQQFAESGAKLAGDQVVTLNRAGMRAYDACQSGDEFGTLEFWQKFADNGRSKEGLEKLAAEMAAK